MRPFSLAVVLGAVALSLAQPRAASSYAVETCRGELATIVGAQGPVPGTDGPDVIVAHTGAVVGAGGGNDLVCVVGGGVRVDAGAGDDVVDTSQAIGATSVFLGAGGDTFYGGPGQERVYGSAPSIPDDDTDSIDTGAGDDTVISGDPSVDSIAGSPLVTNADRIATGDGNDDVSLAVPGPTGALDVGTGSNRLTVPLSPAVPLLVHARGHAIYTAGRLRWVGEVSSFTFVASGARGMSVSFWGTAGDDSVSILGARRIGTWLATGAGDDSIFLGTRTTPHSSSISAGAGRDRLAVNLMDAGGERAKAVRLDLARHRLDYGPPDDLPDSTVRGIEDVRVGGKVIRVVGTAGANVVAAYGCDVVLRGGAGADRLERAGVSGSCHRSTLVGGGGDDYLIGGRGVADLLLGGVGHDVANGRGGIDACRAEVARNCERFRLLSPAMG